MITNWSAGLSIEKKKRRDRSQKDGGNTLLIVFTCLTTKEIHSTTIEKQTTAIKKKMGGRGNSGEKNSALVEGGRGDRLQFAYQIQICE
jgi:hypothetical protein